MFGGSCAILACAALKRVRHCPWDCDMFPCENFQAGPYPFSTGFLNMQARRRKTLPPALDHNDRPIAVPESLWTALQQKDANALCNFTLAVPDGADALMLPFLGSDVRVDIDARCLERRANDRWHRTEDALLELVMLLYLTGVDGMYPLSAEPIGLRDLKSAFYFTGRHALRLAPIVERYGDAAGDFRRAAAALGAEPVAAGDVGCRLWAFPRVPLVYLLWNGDEQFPARVSVLFDPSIERCFSASGIWALVQRVNIELLKGPTV
jgi:hypothetical protein